MKIKSIIPFLMLMLFAYLVYALGGVTLTTPADFVHTASDNELTFVCNGTEQPNYNITSIDLYTDTGGTWTIAYTDDTNANNNTAKGLSYPIYALTFGELLVWNCRVNYTHSEAAVGEINASTYAAVNKSVRVSYIGTSTLTSPASNFYPLIDNITHTCNGSAESGYNITSITLWTNSSGTWTATSIKTVSTPVNNTAAGNVSIIGGIADGTEYLWNCMINYTKTESFGTINQSLTYADSNKTVFVEFPSVITLNSPADSGYVTGTDTFNWASLNSYSDENYSNCIVYTNLSAWTTYGPTVKTENNTATTTTLALNDRAYTWNVKCYEPDNTLIYGFSALNYTFIVDTTTPIVTVDSLNTVPFVNGTWIKTTTIEMNFTLTDTNAQDCDLWAGLNGATLVINQTAKSITSGISTNITLNYGDGNTTFYLGCNDSAGNWVNSSQYDFRVDTLHPATPTIANNSRNGYCDQWNITVTDADEVNATLDYGITAAKGSFLYETDFSTTQEFSLPSQSENTLYYYNITICDVAGNCNETSDYTYTFPFKVCSGWTYLGIYEVSINMSDIASESGADYVYSWNQTNQEWFYYLGSGAGGINLLKYGDAVMLYESTNSTWTQNRTGTGFYNYNITSGDNYIPITVSSSFGNLSTALMNASDSWGVGTTQLAGGNSLNFTWFDAYNNSALDWIGGYTYDVAYNWTWNNNTRLEKSSGTEVVWLYSDYNISDVEYNATWNGTSLTWYNGSEFK